MLHVGPSAVIVVCFGCFASAMIVAICLLHLDLFFFAFRFLVLVEDEDCWMCGSSIFLLGRATFVTLLVRQFPSSLSSCSDSEDVSSIVIACTYMLLVRSRALSHQRMWCEC